jgi:hypothetical protein
MSNITPTFFTQSVRAIKTSHVLGVKGILLVLKEVNFHTYSIQLNSLFIGVLI